MKNYLKLVDFELKRFWKAYAVLIGILVVGESIITAMSANSFANIVERALRKGKIPEQQSLGAITNSDLFIIPIIICIVVLVLYIFFMWYREWFGKNTFAFQLLALPISRMSIFYAKFTALLLFIGGFLIAQIAMYPILNGIYKFIVPEVGQEYGTFMSWIAGSILIHFLLPASFVDFVVLYGIGITSVAALFTIIIIERSYRMKGIVLGIIYGIFSLTLLVLPIILLERLFLYHKEYLMVTLLCTCSLLVVSLLISTYLMNKKIWI